MQRNLPIIFIKTISARIKIVSLFLFLGLTLQSISAEAQPPNNTAGDCGQTLRMDGVNDYVSVPYSPTLNTLKFSVSLWVKVTEYATDFRAIAASRYSTPLKNEKKVLLNNW